jgi:hypothetical protein
MYMKHSVEGRIFVSDESVVGFNTLKRTIPEYVWSGWRTPRKPLVITANTLAEIRTSDLLNMNTLY